MKCDRCGKELIQQYNSYGTPITEGLGWQTVQLRALKLRYTLCPTCVDAFFVFMEGPKAGLPAYKEVERISIECSSQS